MNNSKQKTIMILGAGQLQVPLLQRAKERGLRIIVVSPDSNQPGISYADVVVNLDVRDEKGILEEARKYQIDGITTDQTDLPVRTAAYVADEMHLPGIGYELGCLFTDKYKMRCKCDELDVPNQKYALVNNLDDALENMKNIKFPAIIKPIDSQASHGVTRVDSFDDLKASFDETASYSRFGEVLIEQWIDGEEFCVDSYILDGKCTVMAVGHYHSFAIDGAFASYETEFPANISAEETERIVDMNRKITEGFGLQNGRTHAEYFLTKDKCYLIEIGARGGGAFFSSDNVRFISGISTEDYMLDYALGMPVNVNSDFSYRYNCCCTLFFYLPENGTIVSTDGLEEVIKLPYIHRNNLNQFSCGMKTLPILDKSSRGFMVITAESYEQLQERINYIRSSIRVMTETENGEILPPIWK
ncbi:MAG: ATP-grasp domain-containing protein [Ruminococcus sp.]|nr:ATP-grasp domain-containing protein [Ruminococcus sp.]